VRARVTWSIKGRLELADVWNYINQESTANALRVLQDIAAAVDRLENHPFSGRMVPEWNQPILRELIVSRYRVMYSAKEEEEEVIVFDVRHVRRRVPKRFRSEWLK
jgi:toxin ParE1/3/4